MKKYIISAFAAITAIVGFTGCKPQAILEVSTGTLEADGGSLMQTVDITSNYPWTAHSDNEWIVLDGTSGVGDGSLTIYVMANTTYSDRTGTVTVSCDEGGLTRTINVTQSQNDAVRPDGEECSIGFPGGEIAIPMMANVEFEIVIPEDADWIESIGTRGLKSFDQVFNIAKNTDESPRTATISFRNAALGIEKKFVVSQSGFVPTLYITHKLQEITVPEIVGDDSSAKVDWGDGAVESYAKGLKHSYAEPGLYVITITGSKLSGCNCASMEGVTDIDFSGI